MYYRNNTDINQVKIVKALRQIPGVSVYTGVDDILVGYQDINKWFEIKNPAELAKRTGKPFKRTKKGSATYIKQQKLKENWCGHYEVVSTLDEILADLGIK